MRVLILCTHNSARSQMAEGWLRALVAQAALSRGSLDVGGVEIASAGTEATQVKSDAIAVMREAGIDLSGHRSKTLFDLPNPWDFDVVITVCDSAAEACPSYPAKTQRLHYPFVDPSGLGLEAWRVVRDQIKKQMQAVSDAWCADAPWPPSYEKAPSLGL